MGREAICLLSFTLLLFHNTPPLPPPLPPFLPICVTQKTFIELGYSSDTRYMDKVIEKIEQHAELCKLLAVKGYDVMLLPVVLGSAGTPFKCLDRAAKEMNIPNGGKKETTKSHLHNLHILQNLLSQRRYLQR
jgi:hypothetical protein